MRCERCEGFRLDRGDDPSKALEAEFLCKAGPNGTEHPLCEGCKEWLKMIFPRAESKPLDDNRV